MTTPERPPLPDVNELALRLAARVLRRDVDGGEAQTEQLYRCKNMQCSTGLFAMTSGPGRCWRCHGEDVQWLGVIHPPPPAPSPEDELKALARDIETFADLVVARLGSVRWELERAEKQLRVQDGEIEELQSKLEGARREGSKAARIAADQTRERAAKLADKLADGVLSATTAGVLRAAASGIRALPLAGARHEDDTAPETPAARAGEVVALYRCRREDPKWGPCNLKDAPTLERHCGCCGHETEPCGRVRLVPVDVPAEAPPPPAPENLAAAPAVRYECKNEHCKWRGETSSAPGWCPGCTHELVRRTS
jgi:hypothetical protein